MQALAQVPLPDSTEPLGAYRPRVSINDKKITVTLPFPVENLRTELAQNIQAAFDAHHLDGLTFTVAAEIITHKVKNTVQTLPGVKNIIAVASGKGGVGKSTTTANLAAALAHAGARVGVLDADLYGPSQPAMFAVSGEKPVQQEKMFLPVVKNGIQLMSIGFLVDKDQSLVWRGPLLNQGLQQLFFHTQWDNVDYLLIDLPPGTGDVQLTMAQKLPVTGAVIVTTPQDIALLDARKGIDMFRKTGIPVLGILENMSVHICENCGHAQNIFGQDGGKNLAGELDVPLLGQLPLALNIRNAMDAGNPFSLPESEPAAAEIYRRAAQKLTYAVARMGKDYSHTFPKMVVAGDNPPPVPDTQK